MNTSELLIKVLESIALFAVLIFVRRYLIKSIDDNRDIILRRRWVVTARNAIIFIFFIGIVVIWFEQLRILVATLTVVSVAIVVATKEMLLNWLGYIYRSGSHFFNTGDRIEIDGCKGDVVDLNIMGTTLLEVDNDNRSKQYTGRTIFIPNGKFLSHQVANETHIEDYVFHLFTVPLDRNEDWEKHEKHLLDAAKEVVSEYNEDAWKYVQYLQTKHGLDSPTVDPTVHVRLDEPDLIKLVMRVPSPARRRGRTEQLIIRKYLKAVGGKKVTKKKITKKATK